MSDPAARPLAPLRVLIVEDEGLIAMQLEAILEEAGHVVVGWATSLREAMTLVGDVAADLALVDVHLADGATGIEVARQIRANEAATVVFMTANASKLPADFAGAAGVIAKPYTASGLRDVLGYLHQGVRVPPPTHARPGGLTLSPRYEDAWKA